MHEFLYILVECVYNYGKLKRLKIKIFNHEICVAANSAIRKGRRKIETHSVWD